jgi:hypothetical protein
MDFRVRVMMERLGRNDADALREVIEPRWSSTSASR